MIIIGVAIGCEVERNLSIHCLPCQLIEFCPPSTEMHTPTLESLKD
ncbi:hypothetical protein [Syntrophomonas palmitatica]|nr:hypothetical protein [Syntrophomonas palmitatica]